MIDRPTIKLSRFLEWWLDHLGAPKLLLTLVNHSSFKARIHFVETSVGRTAIEDGEIRRGARVVTVTRKIRRTTNPK